MNETKTEYQVPEENFARLSDRIEKLNRKAVKLGCAPVAVTVVAKNLLVEWVSGEDSLWRSENEIPPARFNKTGALRTVLTVTVSGEAPKFAGWTFAATLAISDGGTILRKAPGIAVELTEFRDAKPVCEHCKLERNRRDTFVLLHDNGNFKQVGRNCLRDFLGHASPEHLAQLAEWRLSLGDVLGEAEFDGESDGGRIERLFDVDTFLGHVAAFTLKSGFISRKQAHEREQAGLGCDPTASSAAMNMFPPKLWVAKGLVLTVSEEASALARAAREHALTVLGALTELNDFQHNLLTVARCEALQSRNLGIAAYIVENYRRDMERAEKTARLAADAKHWGTVKTRYKGQTLAYLGSNAFDSQFGTCFIHRFATEDGAMLVWKTGTGLNYDNGFKFVCDFTVKEHGEFRGVKQTSITRLTEKGGTVKN